ncbi:unnamed protein product [Chrysoparadoxa australica]
MTPLQSCSTLLWGAQLLQISGNMLFFILYYAVQGVSFQEIFGELYFLPGWSYFFSIFHSIPLTLIGSVLCFIGLKVVSREASKEVEPLGGTTDIEEGKEAYDVQVAGQDGSGCCGLGKGCSKAYHPPSALRFTMYWCMAMCMHSTLDFFLHNDDAHKHFLPFSSYQFISPVRPNQNNDHYGYIVGPIEAVLSIAGGVWILKNIHWKNKCESRCWKVVLGFCILTYVALFVFNMLYIFTEL